MNNHVIYKLTFPNNKVYIGQTKSKFNLRLNQYKHDAYNNKRKFYNSLVCRAIRKYDWDNIKQEILLYCCESYVDFFERAFISGYNSNDKNYGYNVDSGGNKNKKRSKETLLKISGKNHHMYGKENLKLQELNKLQKGENHPMYGKRHSSETKLKLRTAKLGKTIPKQYKSVDAYTKYGEYIKTFESIQQAAIDLNVCRSHISAVCKNKLKSNGGYKFKYHIENTQCQKA